MFTTDGDLIYLDGKEWQGNGLDDTMAVARNFYAKLDPINMGGYRYCNVNFPDIALGEKAKLPSDSDRHFWWQYFWICKGLGINLVRLGWSAASELSDGHRLWRKQRDAFFAFLDDMADMALANGVHLIFNFGCPRADGGSFDLLNGGYKAAGTGTVGSLWDPDSDTFAEFFALVSDVMEHFKDHQAFLAWDLANEPDHNNLYSQIVNGIDVGYWLRTFGNPTAARAAYVKWAQAMYDEAVSIDHSHFILIGTGGGNMFGWGEALYAQRNTGCDIVGVHAYGSVSEVQEQEYWISTHKGWAKRLGKPCINTEVGWTAPSAPWCTGYWPWYRTVAEKYHIGVVWMQLNGCMDYNRAPYPGYPIAQAVIDSIPPMPAEAPPEPVPEPGPTPTPIRITIKVPITEQGLLTIPAKAGTAQLPDVIFAAQTIVMPARSLIIPSQKITVPRWPYGTTTVIIPQQAVSIPGETIIVKAQTVKQAALTIDITESKVQLPRIDIAAFDVEVTK